MPKGKRSTQKLTAKHKRAMQEGRRKKAVTKSKQAKKCQVKGCGTTMVQNPTEFRNDWYWCPRCSRYTEPPMGSPKRRT
jgi:hypothetical protein